ncbi:24794_t:CDS:2, partial [Gigaspora rosea]
NIVPFVLRPTQDNLEGFSISKIPLAKIFKLDNKAIREVKKTFGLHLDNNNIPKNCTISKIDPHYFGDNMWAYEESMKQVSQDCDKIDVINTDTDDNNSDDQRNYKENRNILNNSNIMSKSKNSNSEKDDQITIDTMKLGDIRNENASEYNENDRPSNHTR